MTRTTPELLSPAGDWDALRAAVANGADAVYFGLEAFNARARAHNFTVEELPTVMRFLHDRNVKGFVALNVLIFSDELAEARRFVIACANAGVDAVIVQDLGLVRLIRDLAPTLPVHASTQMTLTEPRGIAFVRGLGVERVVLARELSLDEIRTVTAGTDTPVEVFVHGALCVAYSGQCLTSEALGGRSANRGQCAQACRLPYEMVVDGETRDLGDKAYLLSPQDLAAYELIQPLIEAGVISFKIEGRLKGGPYVAATTQTYRTAIDAALAHRAFKPARKDELDLAQTFSRGLAHGFLDGNDHQKLVRGRFPKSRGVRLGKVTGFSKGGVMIVLAEKLPVEELVRPGDGVLFDLGTPEANEPGGRVWRVQAKSATNVELGFEAGAVDFGRIPVGCEVWKTDDPELKKRLTQTYSQDKTVRRERITAVLGGALGGAVALALSTDSGLSASATWPGPLAAATKRPTTPDELREQLGRLGDTPFELGDLLVNLPAGVMLPKSVVNDLRRQAAAALAEKREAGRRHALVRAGSVSDGLQQELAEKREAGRRHALVRAGSVSDGLQQEPSLTLPARNETIRTPELTLLVRTLAQLEAALPLRPAVVYADFEDLRKYKDAVVLARAAGVRIGLATNRVWKPGEDGFQALVARAEPDVVLVRNLGGLSYFKEQLPDAELVGDFSLNVANELTADSFFAAGLSRVVPSFDLNWQQLAALLAKSDAVRYEPVVHQHMPMFHMEHCVFAAFLSTGKDHRDCGRPCDRHAVELRDRVGASFPVLPDTGCRNTVFNSVPQSAAEYMARMRTLGVLWFRIDLLKEKPEEVGPLVNRYRRVIAGTDDGRDTWRHLRAVNQLGVTRGTLHMA